MMQFVATIGRNDPCPCNSGKKFKKCCLPAHEALAAEQRKTAEQRKDPTQPQLRDVVQALTKWLPVDHDCLDALSNSAVDLAKAGQFDQALAACDRLLAEFPEVVDGLERSAMVHAAMGHHALAADFYQKAFEFVTDPSRRDHYEDHEFYREQADKQQRLATAS
jgi:tetratricopeptide (TPR) repeat protein